MLYTILVTEVDNQGYKIEFIFVYDSENNNLEKHVRKLLQHDVQQSQMHIYWRYSKVRNILLSLFLEAFDSMNIFCLFRPTFWNNFFHFFMTILASVAWKVLFNFLLCSKSICFHFSPFLAPMGMQFQCVSRLFQLLWCSSSLSNFPKKGEGWWSA